MHEPMDRRGIEDGEHCLTPQHVASERSSPFFRTRDPVRSTMCFSAQCRREISMDCCGDPSTDEHAVELFRRATVQADQDARALVQQYLGDVVGGWLRQHPRREIAYYLVNEEYYIATTFVRFWQLAFDRQLEFSTFDSVILHLRLCLNGAILDMLRTSSRPKEFQLPRPDFLRKQQMEDETSCHGVWEGLQKDLLNTHEQRLAYLLFHCGLKHQEIIHHCSQEFCDVREINRLRLNMMGRLLSSVDHLQ